MLDQLGLLVCREQALLSMPHMRLRNAGGPSYCRYTRFNARRNRPALNRDAALSTCIAGWMRRATDAGQPDR